MRTCAFIVVLAAMSMAGCGDSSMPSETSPPIDVCANGGGLDTDAVSAPFVPRKVGAYCLDPQGQPKTYGDQGKFSMDDVCTTADDQNSEGCCFAGRSP